MIEPETIHLCCLCSYSSAIELHLVSMVMLCMCSSLYTEHQTMFIDETAFKNVSFFFVAAMYTRVRTRLGFICYCRSLLVVLLPLMHVDSFVGWMKHVNHWSGPVLVVT